MPKFQQYKDRVLKYLSDAPGVVVWRDDMERDLNLEGSQISNCIANAILNDPFITAHVEVVARARAWRWSEPKPDAERPKIIMPGDKAPEKAPVSINAANFPAPTRRTSKPPQIFEYLTTTRGGTILVRGDDGQVYRLGLVED